MGHGQSDLGGVGQNRFAWPSLLNKEFLLCMMWKFIQIRDFLFIFPDNLVPEKMVKTSILIVCKKCEKI